MLLVVLSLYETVIIIIVIIMIMIRALQRATQGVGVIGNGALKHSDDLANCPGRSLRGADLLSRKPLRADPARRYPCLHILPILSHTTVTLLPFTYHIGHDMYTCIYTYIYIYNTYMCVYIYIYIEREREI